MSASLAAVAPAPRDFKSDIKPVWCPGCGDYSVLSAFTKAFATLGLKPEEIAVISGIGCSSRIPAYTNCYGFHGVHGRALALGTGLKVARPELTVIVAGGDGDGFSIGGNHFLHACRRNVDLTYIVMDNHVYGMTKGQPSPTTEPAGPWVVSRAPISSSEPTHLHADVQDSACPRPTAGADVCWSVSLPTFRPRGAENHVRPQSHVRSQSRCAHTPDDLNRNAHPHWHRSDQAVPRV